MLGHRPATLSVDGRNRRRCSHEGDAVACTAAPTTRPGSSRFGARDFHRILKAKFGLEPTG